MSQSIHLIRMVVLLAFATVLAINARGQETRLAPPEAMISPDRSTAGSAPTKNVVEVERCVVRFANEVRIPALETGRIVEVSVRANETIADGQTLVRLDDSSLVVTRRAVQLKVESARKDAQDELPIEYANMALLEAEAELEASREVQREARGAVASNTMRRLRLAVERAKLQVAESIRAKQRAELDSRIREAELSQIDAQMSDLFIRSPMDAVVLSVDHQVGEWVNKGDTVVTVAEASTLMIDALIDAQDLPMHLAEGLPVSVHWIDESDRQPQSLRGVIESSDRRWLSEGQYRIHARIENQRRDWIAPKRPIFNPVSTVTPKQNASPGSKSDPSQHWLLQPGRAVKMRIYRKTQ